MTEGPGIAHPRFRVEGRLGFRGFGFRGLGFRVSGLGFRV